MNAEVSKTVLVIFLHCLKRQTPLVLLWNQVGRARLELFQSPLDDNLPASVDKSVLEIGLVLRHAVWKPQRLDLDEVFDLVQHAVNAGHVLEKYRLVQLQQTAHVLTAIFQTAQH